jgi:hypothetical protein
MNSKKMTHFQLTDRAALAYSVLINNPVSFGERARGRSERNGPCIFRGYE